MKASRLFLCFVFLSATFQSNAAWDIWQAYIITNINGGGNAYQQAGLDMSDPTPTMVNNYYGRFTSGDSFVVKGGEMKTYKNGASNVCGGNIHYRVYRSCDAPGSFTTVPLTFSCNFPCTGLNNAGDQKWSTSSGTTNILSGLTAPGMYILEVYWDATGDDIGGCSIAKYASNGGLNFRAYFEYEINDSFTDGTFATPTWSGDASNFSITNNSTTAGLTGAEAFRTHTVKLNAPATNDSEYLSTQITTWDQQQEWYFWLGRNNLGGGAPQDFDANNQQAVWLYANEANLESATVDGYRILMGENSTSFIRLQRIDNGVATTVFTSAAGIPNGLTDFGITFKVTRSQTGAWVIRTSSLPTDGATTQASPNPNGCPETLSTINHGGVTDNTYAPAANSYFGFQAIHDNSNEGRVAAEFDNFRFRALAPDTYLQINGPVAGTADENVAVTGNLAIGVTIFNPHATNSTTVQLVLTSGSAARAGGGLTINTAYAPSYTTQTLTWIGGETGTKYFYIDPADNALCDDIATLVFQLQNPAGGTNAFINTPNNYTATIVDDNMGYETILSDNFNSGNLTSWITTGTSWSASSVAPITGSGFSARHDVQASTGQSSITHPIDDNNLTGVNTTWRFELNFENDATANNNFQVFLSASENNLFSNTVDGYAVVVDQSSLPSAGSNDYIRLYRVDNGVYSSTPIFTNAVNLDWQSNVNSGTRVGVEVTLNDSGTWNAKVDANGGFDALVSIGSGTDLPAGALTYPVMKGFGVRFNYTPSASDLLRFDEVTISQNGCREIWYSQTTGVHSGTIWGPAPSSAAQSVVSGRYDRFVIQNTNNVTVNGPWILNDITMDSGGTLTGGSQSLKVFGNWINNGSFVAGTSSVTFKGQSAQVVVGSSSTTFNDLVIDNDGSSLTVGTAANVTGVVYVEEGSLQTGGLLTLVSNVSGSASIGEIKAGASVSGNVTLQRYTPSIPWTYGNWVNLGSPILGQTIASWNDDIITTGFTGSDYPPPYPFNNIRKYDETANGAMSNGYISATNVTDGLETSRGYFVWLQGAAQTIVNTGAIQTGTFTHPLSYTVTSPGGIFDYGWNLMTNPYPSEVDWHLVSSTLSGPRVYYVFDHQSNAYKFYNAQTQTGTASRYIPHSQSFLVKANVAGQSLAYQESYKTHVGTAFERSEDDAPALIALQLSHNDMSDLSFLVFSDDADNAYDNMDVFDLESISEDAVEFSLMSSDNVGLAQDSRPFNQDISIPVYLDLPEAGDYVFTVSEVQNLPVGACLYVEDLETGSTMSLFAGESMIITASAAYQGNRLLIHGSAPVQLIATDASCFNEADGSLDITAPAGSWSIALTDEMNDIEYVSAGSITFDHLAAGTYQLEVINNNGGCGSNVSTVVIGEPMDITASITEVQMVPCNIGNEGSISWSINNAEWFTYDIIDESGTIIRSGEIEGTTGFEENLPAASFLVNVYNTCGTETFTVDLRDPNAADMIVSVPSNTSLVEDMVEITFSATAGNATGISWLLSNGMSGTGEEFTVSFTTPGVYSYTVTATGECERSVSGTFNVNAAVAVDEVTENTVALVQRDGGVQLTFSNAVSGQIQVRIFDVAGREVVGKKANGSGQKTFIDMSTLSTGMYFVQVISGGEKIFTSKVIKK